VSIFEIPIPARRFFFSATAILLVPGLCLAAPQPNAPAADASEASGGAGVNPVPPAAPPAASDAKTAPPAKPEAPKEKEATPKPETKEEPAPVDPDDDAAVEAAEVAAAAVARPVSADPVQIYGWREFISIQDVGEKLKAKLDTGALTSSIHAEEKELFERDGKKWVRFIVTDPTVKKPTRTRLEAPLVRIARIKEPGGESITREVVRLSFQIGDRKLRGDFTLNNRSNMLAPVLIGRSTIRDLGWVDSERTYLADQKIFR
jgi:hypothetical protein